MPDSARRWTLVGAIVPPEVFEDVRQDASPVETLSLDALRRKRISQTQSLTSNYIRVYVWVSADLSIPCIIEKSTTVQTLAKTVEAEYFFRHGKTLSCCILTNDAWDPLHFDHKIGRRFEHESHFRVFDYTVELQMEYGLWLFDTSLSLAFGSSSSQEADWDSMLLRMINDSAMGDLFHDYLKDKRSLEHLLFWLDAIIYKNSKIIPQTTMRVYIALTYFTRNAPLSISVNSETKSDLTSMLTSIAPADYRILDDALLQIQWILKLHMFNFMKLNPVKSWRPRPRPIYGSGLKHGDIQSVVNHILEKSDVHVSKTFEKNIDRFMASAATIDPKNVDREELLGMVNRRFYPHLAGELSRTPYFLDIDLINGRITVQKSQRLSKLFGEQLSMKDLKNQVSQHINEEDLIFSVTETSPIYEEEPSEAAQRSSNVKKFSRIKGFFGEAIPMTDVKNQLHQGSETSLLNEESEAVEKVSAENADEKDKLMKTWIKLQAFLGERVPLRLMMSQKKYSSTSKLEDTDALLDSSQPERQDPAHHFSSAIRAMSKLIHNSKDAIDLLIAFSILDADSEQRVVSEVHSSSAVHQKKAVKLEALLGSEVGVTSVIRQIESKILTDLQKWIHLEIKNPEDVTKLTEDLNLLRKTFDAKISLMALDVAS